MRTRIPCFLSDIDPVERAVAQASRVAGARADQALASALRHCDRAYVVGLGVAGAQRAGRSGQLDAVSSPQGLRDGAGLDPLVRAVQAACDADSPAVDRDLVVAEAAAAQPDRARVA